MNWEQVKVVNKGNHWIKRLIKYYTTSDHMNVKDLYILSNQVELYFFTFWFLKRYLNDESTYTHAPTLNQQSSVCLNVLKTVNYIFLLFTARLLFFIKDVGDMQVIVYHIYTNKNHTLCCILEHVKGDERVLIAIE